MTDRRCVAVWLDGTSVSLLRRLVSEGEMPRLAALLEVAATVPLDHGASRLTGLAGEQLASGLDSADAGRASAVHFDTATYRVSQRGAVVPPVFGEIGVPVVAFDVSYFRMQDAPTVRGVLDWGAHDPGGPATSTPPGLLDEIIERFGPYPAREFVYGFTWTDPERTRRSGEALAAALRARSEVVRWLLTERLTDWRLAIVGVSEIHSALETLWHGIDAEHALASHPSAPVAGEAVRTIHRALDELIGDIVDAFPDDAVTLFAMHGMGPNGSDVVSMAALGEIVTAWDSGRPTTTTASWDTLANGTPVLPAGAAWSPAVAAAMQRVGSGPGVVERVRGVLDRRLPGAARRRAERQRRRADLEDKPLRWIPLTRHAERWPEMRAFAIPSFYDGRVRVNLVGREAQGRVRPEEYDAVLDELETVLRACTDPVSGEPAVAAVHRPVAADPFAAGGSEADLVVEYRGRPLGLAHPALGVAGPYPPRRTGGHTDPAGVLLSVRGPALVAVPCASAQDVAPTLVDIVGGTRPRSFSGRSLVAAADPSG